jgi:hypothetical protein
MGINFWRHKSKEEKFWIWFIENQSTYYEQIENLDLREKIFDKLSTELNKIHKDLMFEFSPINDHGIRAFTISAEGNKKLFPLVVKLIKKAPQLINWKFSAFRQRVLGDDFQIKYRDFKIGYSDLFFKYRPDGKKIGLELNIRGYDEKPRTQNAIYILLDGLIGEYDLTMEISWIEWVKVDEENINSLYPITHLRTVIDKNKNVIE